MCLSRHLWTIAWTKTKGIQYKKKRTQLFRHPFQMSFLILLKIDNEEAKKSEKIKLKSFRLYIQAPSLSRVGALK